MVQTELVLTIQYSKKCNKPTPQSIYYVVKISNLNMIFYLLFLKDVVYLKILC